MKHLSKTSNILKTYIYSNSSLSNLRDSIEILGSTLINSDTFKTLHAVRNSSVLNNRLSQLVQEYKNLNASLVNNSALTELSHTLLAIKNSTILHNKLTQFIDTYNTIQTVLKNNSEYMKIYNAIQVLQSCSSTSLNEQLEIIEKVPESNFKQYLRQNHLAILSLILSIVFFIWQNYNDVTVEQNNKIISLLEQSNKTQTELLKVQKDKLSEEQTQTELIKID